MDKDVSSMSAEEIEEQLQQLAQNKRALEKALERKKSRRKTDLAVKVREMILAEGFEVDEILELVDKKKRGAGGGEKPAGSYRAYVDPDNPNNSYSRGVLPGWMKARMEANGLDPANKADREAFKARFLRAVIRTS